MGAETGIPPAFLACDGAFWRTAPLAGRPLRRGPAAKGGRRIGGGPRFILHFMVFFWFLRPLRAVNCELWIHQC